MNSDVFSSPAFHELGGLRGEVHANETTEEERAHFYDGPDEIHISTVGRLVLREYRKQEEMGKATWDFALRG